MRIIGFSTGALNPGDPQGALEKSVELGLKAIELSALRLVELEGVAESVLDRRLAQFDWVSVHAPSKIPPGQETDVVDRLVEISAGRYPVIVHPDVIRDRAAWTRLGGRLLLENMDQRKSIGRFADELTSFYEDLPEAGLCLDVAHVRQIDPSMTEAFKFLRLFGERLRELHVSELTSESKHRRVSLHASSYLKEFLAVVPPEIPVIVESGLGGCEPIDEIRAVSSLLGETLTPSR